MHESISWAEHSLTPTRANSSVNIEPSVLHPREMNRTENRAVNPESSHLVSCEGHIVAYARLQREADGMIVIYSKAMGLGRIAIYKMNRYRLPQGHVHYRPGQRVDHATVVSLVCYDDREIRRAGAWRRIASTAATR